jgi:hypothetical protein
MERMLRSKVLDEKATRALRMVNDAGFSIVGPVRFALDERLPFMGYATFKRQEHLIVVAGRALSSEMIEGLLIHELSHVYRTEKNHPSHNRVLLNGVEKQIRGRFKIHAKYQGKILQEIVNHVQDLYADDISFQVFKKNQTSLGSLDQIGEFFVGWMVTEPIQSKNKKMEAWLNLSAMLNNAFITSNLERHRIERFKKKASKMHEIFLSRIDSHLSRSSSYFRTYMTNLKEEVKEQEFKQELLEYMTRFLELAVSSQRRPIL